MSLFIPDLFRFKKPGGIVLGSIGFLCATVPLKAHNSGTVDFPDIDGYQTLVCDLHQHTVLSDGLVWPSIRVQEALRDGVDVIAITDHLEYQPHKEDIPHPDRNRGHGIATEEGVGKPILVIQGAEITRAMPPGHMNAIFIKDANRLLTDDPIDLAREAVRQGGFIFWNHPSWDRQRPDGVARLTEMHEMLIKQGLLHGIEVVNGRIYSANSLQIAIDHNLTILGTSDIHGIIDWEYGKTEGGHRPVTLVFAEERSTEAVRQALINRQTVVCYDNTLIGRDDWIQPLLQKAVTATHSGYRGKSSLLQVELSNHSSTTLTLRNVGALELHNRTALVTLKPNETAALLLKTLGGRERVELEFEVLSALTAPETHPVIRFHFEPGPLAGKQ